MKKAFTLIELILVMVVMGIIALIGTDIITRIYQNYIRTQVINELEAKAQQALEVISRRYSFRILGSEGIVKSNNFTDIKTLAQHDENDKGLIWIGVSHETREYWSGILDLQDKHINGIQAKVKSPASNFNNDFRKINEELYTARIKDPWLVPVVEYLYRTQQTIDCLYNPSDTNGRCIVKPNLLSDNYIEFNTNEYPKYLNSDKSPILSGGHHEGITDKYLLVNSAYAIVSVKKSNTSDETNNDLRLFYNFQPWNKDKTFAKAKSTLLAENVSTFRFLRYGDSLRIKLCLHDNNKYFEDKVGVCKETVVH